MTAEQERLSRAIARATAREERAARGNSIGTLKEKTLHTVLKYFFEPDENRQEVKVGRYVADIRNDAGIIEIQTRNFSALRKKLTALLKENRVTVVYPIARRKWISWIDPETGEATAKRRSPKTGTPQDAAYELYKIRPLLRDPNLTICIVLLDVMETRFLNGWSRDKKRGACRCDCLPVAFAGMVSMCGREEYTRLLPDGLPETFTSRDFKACAHISLACAQRALNILLYLGAVEQAGKAGRLRLYKPAAPVKPELPYIPGKD